MSWVGLNLQALTRPPDNAVQDADGLIILDTTSESAANLDRELVLDLFLEEIQMAITPRNREVVAVND